MKTAAAQCRFILFTADPMLRGLDDSHRALEPVAGSKTAGWILGHLATTGDFARRLCGRPPVCPKEWRPHFSPGTTPSTDPATYPPMAALVQAFRDVYGDLPEAATAADPAALAAENPFAPAREGFPTAGEFVRYIMNGHFSYHLGQLVGWRAAAGLGRTKNYL